MEAKKRQRKRKKEALYISNIIVCHLNIYLWYCKIQDCVLIIRLHNYTSRAPANCPSTQSPVVSILSLTRLQLSGTNSLFLLIMLPLSVLFKSSLKTFLFSKTFSSVPLPWDTSVCVCACVCVCMLYALNLKKYVHLKKCVSAYGQCGLGALSTHYYLLWSAINIFEL